MPSVGRKIDGKGPRSSIPLQVRILYLATEFQLLGTLRHCEDDWHRCEYASEVAKMTW